MKDLFRGKLVRFMLEEPEAAARRIFAGSVIQSSTACSIATPPG
jgi:hypothetical protein